MDLAQIYSGVLCPLTASSFMSTCHLYWGFSNVQSPTYSKKPSSHHHPGYAYKDKKLKQQLQSNSFNWSLSEFKISKCWMQLPELISSLMNTLWLYLKSTYPYNSYEFTPIQYSEKKKKGKVLLFPFYIFCRSQKIHLWIWVFFPIESQYLTSWSSNDVITCHVFSPPIKNLEVLLLKASLSSTIKPSPVGPPETESSHLKVYLCTHSGHLSTLKCELLVSLVSLEQWSGLGSARQLG